MMTGRDRVVHLRRRQRRQMILGNISFANISIAINDGTPVLTAHSTGVFASVEPFALGSQNGGLNFFDSEISKLYYFDRALTDEEKTALYNEGE